MGVRCASAASIASLLGVLACSAEVEDYGSDAAVGSTHALITVERSSSAGTTQDASAGALAGFVRVPVEVDPRIATQLMGLELELPEVDGCHTIDRNEASGPLAGMGRVELLDAGDVSLSTNQASADLAPRAFPTVTDSISGVMYTTRGRAAGLLPPRARYSFRTTGGADVPAVAANAEAPAPIADAAVSGVPISEVRAVRTRDPMDLTWSVGEPGDVVWVQLSTLSSTATVCAFRDDAGVGTVPAGAFQGRGEGRIAFHRQRTVDFSSAGLDRGVLRFDFEVTATVAFVD